MVQFQDFIEMFHPCLRYRPPLQCTICSYDNNSCIFRNGKVVLLLSYTKVAKSFFMVLGDQEDFLLKIAILNYSDHDYCPIAAKLTPNVRDALEYVFFPNETMGRYDILN